MANDDGGKRKWKGRGGGGKKKIKLAASARGCKGILFTCDQHREREAVAEASNLLNEYLDMLYPSGGGAAESPPQETSLSSQLAAEIAELKQEAKQGGGRFCCLDTGCKGLIMFKLMEAEVDPVAVTRRVMEDLNESKEKRGRYLSRMIPLSTTCFASVDAMMEAATPFIQGVFGKAGGQPIKFCVESKKRNCGDFDRQEATRRLAKAVGDAGNSVGIQHEVELAKPDVVILLEMFKSVCGLSIVQNYFHYKKFNIRGVTEVGGGGGGNKNKNKKSKEGGEGGAAGPTSTTTPDSDASNSAAAGEATKEGEESVEAAAANTNNATTNNDANTENGATIKDNEEGGGGGGGEDGSAAAAATAGDVV